jgi:hypothetical protein
MTGGGIGGYRGAHRRGAVLRKGAMNAGASDINAHKTRDRSGLRGENPILSGESAT